MEDIESINSIEELEQKATEIVLKVKEVSSHLENITPVILPTPIYWAVRILQYVPIATWIVYFYTEYKLYKFLNKPFYKSQTPFSYVFFLNESVEEYVKIVHKIQSLCTKDDEKYFKGVNESISYFIACFAKWREINQWAETYEVKTTANDKVNLAPQIARQIINEFNKIDLPEDLSSLKQSNLENNRGCFGFFIGLIAIPSAFILYIIY